jgi:hypothetical protein
MLPILHWAEATEWSTQGGNELYQLLVAFTLPIYSAIGDTPRANTRS